MVSTCKLMRIRRSNGKKAEKSSTPPTSTMMKMPVKSPGSKPNHAFNRPTTSNTASSTTKPPITSTVPRPTAPRNMTVRRQRLLGSPCGVVIHPITRKTRMRTTKVTNPDMHAPRLVSACHCGASRRLSRLTCTRVANVVTHRAAVSVSRSADTRRSALHR